MKEVLVAVLAVGLFFSAVNSYAAEELTLKTPKEKMSYIIGVQLGNKLLISDQEAKDFVAAYQKEKAAKFAEERKKLGENNKEEGATFLAENKQKEGVKTLPSGLQYKVLKEGTGRTPKVTDTVVVQYKGTLVNGTEFASSYRTNKPATFPVNGIMRGWTEALQLMKEGSTWQIFIPPELAYGEQGAGPIGPNATLIFKIELIAVK
jgi:FKBP-type peptidyl-prolyl cis-trans isomerase FklB